MDIEEIKKAVPVSLKNSVTPDLVDKLNGISTDPIIAKHIQDNFISYASVLMDGKYKIEDFVNAVAYASYKLMDMTNSEAYERTFPSRYASLKAKGLSAKAIASYVSMYHRNKIVQSILQRSMIPFWLLNQDARQQALNVQVDLMFNAKSEKVKSMAAESILNHTKEPDIKGTSIAINIKNTGLDALEEQINKLAKLQRQSIIDGVATTKDIAGSDIVEGEYEEADS